jgi:heme A synthase
MEQIYYGVAVFIYSLFIVRFILSWVGGDFDVDMDVDTDLDLSDVVSFKGATHFLMGFFGWLSVKSFTTHNVMWYDYLIAFALGVIFVIILYYVYKFLMKLENKPKVLSGKALIGSTAKVYLVLSTIDADTLFKYVVTADNGVGTVEIPAKSRESYKTGDSVVIKDYVNAYYII